MKRNEQRLASLRETSGKVWPLKLRRIAPTKPLAVVSLCDWADEEVRGDHSHTVHLGPHCPCDHLHVVVFSVVFQDTVRRGDQLILKSNSDNKDWKLQTSSGRIKTLPGACFMIPPPDAESLEKVKG